MPEAIAALGRSAEVVEITSRMSDAQRHGAAQAVRQQVNTDVKPETARPVEQAAISAESTAARQPVATRRPALSSEIRSMLLAPQTPASASGSTSTTKLVARLLDALRAYERRAG